MEKIKYYGTLGPTCHSEEMLRQMLDAGMTGVRLNLSHTGLRECEEWIAGYQNAQQMAGVKADLLIDLQGPELRIGTLRDEISLTPGDEVLFYAQVDGLPDTEELRLPCTEALPVPEFLPDYLKTGQKVLLNDGIVRLEVIGRNPSGVICRVLRGGSVSSHKSIALECVEIPSPTLTEADLQNLMEAEKYGVTEVMLPFVRGRKDVENLRAALDSRGLQSVKIFAKIENRKGVEALDEIMEAADDIIIARGDLGNAAPLWKLPGLQKMIAKRCREAGKPFMVVTQMLHSMTHMPVPTRAEVLDVYNAVLDGASMLMLTEETAVGEYPVEAMRYLILTAEEARKK